MTANESRIGIECVFNLEKAPWCSRVFERMVKSMKRCLRKFVGQAQFKFDEMHTAFVEIEGNINSHPISYLDSNDVEEPLTLSHLLVGCRILNLPDNLVYCEDDRDKEFEITHEPLQK